MRNLIGNLIVIFELFVISSCSTKVNLNIPEIEPLIVVNSLISDKSLIVVNLSYTSPNSTVEEQKINNAEINLFVNDVFAEKLKFTETGKYISSFYPEVGKKYKIEINVQGFDIISAETEIPSKVSISEGYYKYNSTYVHQQSNYLSEAKVTFMDFPSENNYYLVTFYHKCFSGPEIWDEVSNTWIIEDTTEITYRRVFYLRSNDPVIENENDLDYLGIDGSSIYFLVFSDELLTEENTVEFIIDATETLCCDNYVIIRSINYDLYKYYKSLIRQNYNSGSMNMDLSNGFLSNNPNDLYTNVENGLGIFAGYSQTDFKLTEIE